MKTLVEKFNEVKDQIPYNHLGMNGHDGQTLYGDVMDWCRDCFGSPKDSCLAYMLVGYWYTEQESKIVNKKKNTAILNKADLKAVFMLKIGELIDKEYKHNRDVEDLYGVMDFRHQYTIDADGNEEHDFEPDCSHKIEEVWEEVWEKYFQNGTAHITPECEAEWEMYYNTADEFCGHADTQDAGFVYHGTELEVYGHC